MDRAPIRHITILGNAGSGKSTLAREIGARIDAPVVHLDKLYWNPGWTKSSTQEFQSRLHAALAGDSWICEGNYYRQTFPFRLPRSDLIIWLVIPASRCLVRVIKRSVLNQPRMDLPAGCREKLDADFLAFLHYVWRFDRESRPAMEADRLAVAPHVPVVAVSSRDQYQSVIARVVASQALA